jgi:hypothetical protein
MAGVGRTVGVPALLCVLALVGCTPDPGGPTPFPTPTATQTPSESAQERQERLDYAAAEKAYRTFRAEFNRLLRIGGRKHPTRTMTETAGGSYLKETAEVIQAYKGLGNHQAGAEKTAYVRRSGYSAQELELAVCEDTRSVRTLDLSGRIVGRGEIRAVKLTVRKTGSRWKLWSGSGRKVSSCD